MYERTNDLIKQKFKSYLFPTVLMTIALSLGVIVDSIIVGQLLGAKALNAVNLCTPVTLLFNTFFSLIGIGGSTLVSIAKGKKDDKGADKVFTSAIVVLASVSVIFLVIGNLTINPLASLLSQNGEAKELVKQYLTPIFWGAPFIIVVSGSIFFIRTDGKPKDASMVIIISNAVNLAFDYFFVGILHTGIIGASISTVAGYFFGGFMLVKYMRSKERTLHLIKTDGFLFKTVGEIISTGLPSALSTGLMFVKNLTLNSIILATLGAAGISAFAVCGQCLTLSQAFVGGTIQTLLPFVGVFYGADEKNSIHTSLKLAAKFAFGASITILIILQVLPSQIAMLFGLSDQTVINIAVKAMRVYTFSLPIYTFSFLLINYYQTTKKRNQALFITFFQGFGFIIPIVYILSLIGDGANLWLGFVISEIFTAVLAVLAAKAYAKKSKGQFKGLLLEKSCDCHGIETEFTVSNKIEDAVGISHKIMDFCKENGIDSTRVQCAGLVTEEIAVNTIKYGYKKKKLEHIDINVKIVEGNVIIRLRDDGVFFNPMTFKTEDMDFSGIENVKKVSRETNYSRVLGFNNTIIKL